VGRRPWLEQPPKPGDYSMSGNDLFGLRPVMDCSCDPHVPGCEDVYEGDTKMKMLVTRIVIMATMAVAPLFSAGAAYAQRYHQAPGYNAAQQYRSGDYRSPEDQRIIDEITRNDASAGQ
jgi:hypothetical protein